MRIFEKHRIVEMNVLAKHPEGEAPELFFVSFEVLGLTFLRIFLKV